MHLLDMVDILINVAQIILHHINVWFSCYYFLDGDAAGELNISSREISCRRITVFYYCWINQRIKMNARDLPNNIIIILLAINSNKPSVILVIAIAITLPITINVVKIGNPSLSHAFFRLKQPISLNFVVYVQRIFS